MPRPTPIAALLAVLIAGSGCQVLGDATASIGRERLIDDMARQLERGQELGYYAEYQLAQGNRGSTAQQAEPRVTVYRFPGGLLQQDTERLTACITAQSAEKAARCAHHELPSQAAVVAPGHAEVVRGGMMPAPLAVALVRLAELQPNAVVKQEDATIAGQQATCLAVDLVAPPSAAAAGAELPGVSPAGDGQPPASEAFTVCATADGVLARFTGVVGGVPIAQALIRVSDDAPPGAFDLPPEANPAAH